MIASWVALLALGTSAGSAPSCPPELFRVTRTTNANVVVYEARLTPDGALDDEEPVHASWILLAEDGRREELSPLETALAYGVEARAEREGPGVVVSIRARPGLPIHVVLERGCPVALTRIAGREARLTRVAVAVSGGLFPGVDHVDLVGLEVAGGGPVEERVVP